MQRKRILLAEDHVEMAQRLAALLGGTFDVDIVSDGQALIMAAEAWPPDVIVSDVAMPAISGPAAARSILEMHPEARIVFVSIHDEPAVIRSALATGALGYVVKADAGGDLLNAVMTVLAGRRFISATARAALHQN